MSESYYDNVTFLSHFEEATPIDARGHTIAITAPAATSTEQAKFGGRSLKVDTTLGTGARIAVTGSATSWNFGAAPFTIEAFVYFLVVDSTHDQGIMAHWTATGNQRAWTFYRQATDNRLIFAYSLNGTAFSNVGAGGGWVPNVGQWYHMAVDRNSATTTRVYIDGVVQASGSTGSYFPSTYDLVIGNGHSPTAGSFPGYLDEVRITKGVARYNGAFTPPTSPFSAESAQAVQIRPKRFVKR